MTNTTVQADFSGLTETGCCAGCSVDGCILSGQPYCGHPRKGSLHFSQMQDAAALRRLQQAREYLARESLTARLAAQRIA